MIELYIENLHTHKGRWFELPIDWEEVKEKSNWTMGRNI